MPTSLRGPPAQGAWSAPRWTEPNWYATSAALGTISAAPARASNRTFAWNRFRSWRSRGSYGSRSPRGWDEHPRASYGTARTDPRTRARGTLRALQRRAVAASASRASLRALVTADSLQLHALRDPVSLGRRETLPSRAKTPSVPGRLRDERHAVGVALHPGEHGVPAHQHRSGRGT